MGPVRRVQIAVLLLGLVIVGASVGYLLLGFTPLEAVFQTIITVSTVGYREVRPLSTVGQIFTMFVIVAGVGTALYTFGVTLEALVEGHLRQYMERRRMDREITRMDGHVIICGWGRVGRASASYLNATGRPLVVVDQNADRLEGIEHAHLVGDVTDDAVLQEAGIERAHALIAALDTDAGNVYVTLSARALRRDLVIIARARNEASKDKLLRAGADRAVNPQMIGGRRMAAFALEPHVAEFLDVVMKDEGLEFRIEQVEIASGSRLAGRSLGEADLPAATGVLPLAVRSGRDRFVVNPPADTRLEPSTILIVIGTAEQLESLHQHAAEADGGEL